ncbi:MAG: glycosyltransferase family 2 protein [Anaerolineales bacterium]|nr:glycosyltransferase family 2 protein [Anaerolineales bacterium]
MLSETNAPCTPSTVRLFESLAVADLQYWLTVIVPTRNEAGNVGLLLERIQNALAGLPMEVLFVDDSSDETPQVIQSHSDRYDCLEVNLIHRAEDQRLGGLAGAVVEGMRAAKAPWVCVMDGDLQHPPEIIPEMFEQAIQKQVDLVVASRRMQGSDDSQLGLLRTLISYGLDGVARLLFYRALRGVSDPLTGFFLVRRDAIDLDAMRPQGFKILMEILVRNPGLKKAEVSFQFGARHAGESKASVKEALNYFNLLANLRFGENWLRMVNFGLVGLSGIAVNTLAMALATDVLGIYYLISAVLATLASSTWNFALSEYWVFRAGSQSEGRLKRFGLFFMVNNLALLFRAPMIYGLTSIIGIHYLVSNLLSLMALFIARYFLSANWIWVGAEAKGTPKSIVSTRSKKMADQFYYNIHDIISIVSDVTLPELSSFRVDGIEAPTMRVMIGKPQRELHPERRAEQPDVRHHYYREIFGRFGFEAEINIGKTIEIIASPILRKSPHVLYTNLVEPVLRWAFVERGYALVHGATIAYSGKAYMITARTDTGKTTTLLKILNHQRRESDKAAFISDDMTIIAQDGTVRGYPKPLTISHHTVRAVNPEVLNLKQHVALFFQSRIHSRSGRKVAFFMGRTRLPMATINTIVQWLVPPPKYPVQRLVPMVKFAPDVCLASLFIIERGNEESVFSLDNGEGIQILLSNCEDAYGFPPYESIKEFLYSVNGTDLRAVEQSIICSAFEELPVTVVRSGNLAWWRRIPGYVDQEMAQYFEDRETGALRLATERA